MNRRKFLNTAVTIGAAVALGRSSKAQSTDQKKVVRYPDPAVEVLDERFARLRVGNTAVERLYTGTLWAEGPVWFGDGRYLLWSDIPNNRIMRWVEETETVSVFRSPSNNCNGNTRDRQGRLLTCERRRLTRTEHDGTITVLLDRFKGNRLNSPNDAIVHPDGHIWFTDPGYGISQFYEGLREEAELPTSVYRLNPDTGQVTLLTTELDRPNGLCFSPDYTKLYVADTGGNMNPDGPHQIIVYDLAEGVRLVNGRVFYDTGEGFADGIRCDVAGNVWSSAGFGGEGYDGIHTIAPDGVLIGKIHLPEACANLCFGGAKRNRLFMAASQSLYAVYVETQGAQVW